MTNTLLADFVDLEQTALSSHYSKCSSQKFASLTVGRHTFRGSIFIRIFASPLSRGHLIKEKKCCLSRSKFFPLREDSIWRGVVVKGSNQGVPKVVSLT